MPLRIHDLEGLHRVIAEQLIEKPAPLTGKEFRFPARGNGLFSQRGLWESSWGLLIRLLAQVGEGAKPGPFLALLDTFIRLVARERLLSSATARSFEFVREMSELDHHVDGARLELAETEEWMEETVCQ